jgi:hypothetical protein
VAEKFAGFGAVGRLFETEFFRGYLVRFRLPALGDWIGGGGYAQFGSLNVWLHSAGENLVGGAAGA